MKILVISQYFYPESFRVNDLCRELVDRGHSVTVLTGYPQYPQGKIYDGYGFRIPYDKNWNGVRIERVKMKPRGKTPIGLINNCCSFVREANKWVMQCDERYDAVYVFEVSPVTVGLPAVTYKNKFGTPIIFNVQDLWPDNVEIVLGVRFKPLIKVLNNIVDKIYNASDYILCSSQSFVENIAARGVSREKLYFWPQFCKMPSVDDMKKPSEYSDEYFNIVFAGNIGFAQGLDILAEAAESLKNKNVKWYLVGDGRAKESIEKNIHEKNLEGKVIFVGRVSEMRANEYVHFADCAYFSFKDNKLFDMTIPAKLQTYLACGTPIIAAAGGESKRIIENAQCGLVSKRNSRDLCGAINRMMSLSQSEIGQMRENAEKYFNAYFSKEKVMKSFDVILEKIESERTALIK